MNQAFLNEIWACARDTAVSAGTLTRDIFTQPRQITEKGLRDIVTDADTAAQKLITDTIQAQFPEHGFVTEEKDSTLPRSGPVIWVIDPVDGTSNYARQIPEYCVAVGAVAESGQVVAGAIYDPMRDELFSAARGMGAQVNGRPLQVSQIDQVKECMIAMDWARNKALRQSAMDLMPKFHQKVSFPRVFGSAALAMAWVAAGRIDLYLNFALQEWDIAAASIILAEAGGRLTNLDGRPWTYPTHSGDCIASNGRVHNAFLQIIDN
ncbi:MAG: inositol monophosphatase family protein [Anaerolineae bacterium]